MMSEQSFIIYGIKNCSTVKKALDKLDNLGIVYQFHDYKKVGIDKPMLEHWIAEIGIDTVLNKKGTTWRKLTDEQKQQANNDVNVAIDLMIDNPSMIKRPILVGQGKTIVGFDEYLYNQLV